MNWHVFQLSVKAYGDLVSIFYVYFVHNQSDILFFSCPPLRFSQPCFCYTSWIYEMILIWLCTLIKSYYVKMNWLNGWTGCISVGYHRVPFVLGTEKSTKPKHTTFLSSQILVCLSKKKNRVQTSGAKVILKNPSCSYNLI